MKIYKADLHIHTVLSPCGDLEMSSRNIIASAKAKGLDIIGITDHNSTRNCEVIKKLGEREGVFVLTGAEVNTREDVHCLTFFESTESLHEFQHYIDIWLPRVKNKPEKFGCQVVVDEFDTILEEIEPLLIMGLNQSITEVREKVAELNGIFIPAHINREYSGILHQLGFMPADLNPDAIEFFAPKSALEVLSKFPDLEKYTGIKNSDAHYPEQIGAVYSEYFLNEISFEEIMMALAGIEGRKVNFK